MKKRDSFKISLLILINLVSSLVLMSTIYMGRKAFTEQRIVIEVDSQLLQDEVAEAVVSANSMQENH